jgi:lysophospholipase L1-like esterase
MRATLCLVGLSCLVGCHKMHSPPPNSLTAPPQWAAAGDSIAEGYPAHRSEFAGGDSGNQAFDVLVVADLTNAVNVGYHGARWDQAYAQIQWLGDKMPTNLLVHCGVNDIGQGRTWAQTQKQMDRILSACKAQGCRLWLDEIFPNSNYDDALSATIRAWNTNYAIWAHQHGVILLRTHDTMGQVRASTGQLDDLKPDCSCDGGHLSEAGYRVWARRLVMLVGERKKVKL